MMRIWTITFCLIRDLFLSLAGIVPLAAALAFGQIAFEYGMDQPQFITVAGLGTGGICLLTTLLLAGRANRAWSYLLLARLRSRSELLVGLVLGGLLVTAVLSLLITAANLALGRLMLEFPSVLWILPTWLILWLLMAALALPLSSLAGRAGSHLAGYVLITALLFANDRKLWLQSHGFDGLSRVVTAILWPVGTLLSHASQGLHDGTYFLALAGVLAYALLLFAFGRRTFRTKDLLWAE
jgi:hypothetical protein